MLYNITRVSSVAPDFLHLRNGFGPLGLPGHGYRRAVAILGNLKKEPRLYAKAGTWPDGALRKGAPPEAAAAQHISRVLRDFCAARGLSSRKAAKAAGMTQGAIYNVLSGRAWPNSGVVARIERKLGVVLWPTLHNWEPTLHQSGLEPTPRHYLHSGRWPFGALVGDAPPEAAIALKISEQFHTAFSRFVDIDDAAAQLEISPGAVKALLDGSAWLDWPTIARVERNLGFRIWVPQHRR